MERGKEREGRPMPLKLGAALAISFAGFLYSRLLKRRIIAPSATQLSENGNEMDVKGLKAGIEENDFGVQAVQDEQLTPRTMAAAGFSPCSNKSGDTERFLLPEFNDLVKEFDPYLNPGLSPKRQIEIPSPKSNKQSPKAPRNHALDEYEQEITYLKNMVRILQERERNLEVQLLEYYGLKEQEATMMELQNRLRINGMEAQLFAIKTESLQADNRRLEAQVADCSKVIGELEEARAKIKLLKRKFRFEAEQNKQQVIGLQKKVEKLQEHEQQAVMFDQEVVTKLDRLKELEGEAEELREMNAKLQLENSDLSLRLQLSEVSIVKNQEDEKLKEENARLKQKNKYLGMEIEQLQADRCAEAEELVYLRWVNACLRYELRFNSKSGKIDAADLSKSLSPKSAVKAKKLIMKYADTAGMSDREIDVDSDISSSASYGNVEDSLAGDISSANPVTNARESIFLSKLRKFLKVKDATRKSRAKSEQIVTSISDSMQAYPSESESSQSSSSTSMTTDVSRFITPQSSCDMDDVKDLARLQRNSTTGSSYRFRRYSSDRTSMIDRLDQNMDITPDSDLLNYAEAARGSSVTTPKSHKKSKSFSIFFTGGQ